jgi:hypothetical protein
VDKAVETTEMLWREVLSINIEYNANAPVCSERGAKKPFESP